MKLRIKINSVLFLLSFSCINLFAQGGEQGRSEGGKTTKIWEPDLVELWIYWHKTQYRMFTDFYHNEDTLANEKYEDYKDWMKKLAEVDATLFSQYQNNDVPRPVIFTEDVAYVAILVTEVAENTSNILKMLNEPPVDAELVDMFFDSSVKMYLKGATLITSTFKVLQDRKADNLRDNRLRDDLLNNIVREFENIKLSQNSLYDRMKAGKQNILLQQILNSD